MKIYKRINKKYKKEDEAKIINDYQGVFNDFYLVFKDKENIDLKLFFKRLKSLRIRVIKDNQNFFNKDALAEYNIFSNVMRVKKEEFKDAIMHEILHMSSSLITSKCAYMGFQQIDLKAGTTIGIGFNEAYTNILDMRYFGNYTEEKKNTLKNTYKITSLVVGILENFVGQELMEKWYFSADLNSFIEYMSNYMSRKEILLFLMALDNLFLSVDKGTVLHPRISAKNYEYVINFLGKCYMNLYIKEYYMGAYDKEELKERLKIIYEMMGKRLTFSKWHIPITKKISKKDFRAYVLYEKYKVLKRCA